MGVTIKDVAKMAGVSISTVSKVINHAPNISQPTISHVNEVMRELTCMGGLGMPRTSR